MTTRPGYRQRLLAVGTFTTLLLYSLGCGSTQTARTEKTSTDSLTVSQAPVSADSLCFREILSRDTTTLRLVLAGDRASGQIDINPYEKDRARGSFTGTRSGNTITADWQRSGEGMTETYALTLTLSGDSISWGEGERIEHQGKWTLKQPGGTYRYRLAKTPCR